MSVDDERDETEQDVAAAAADGFADGADDAVDGAQALGIDPEGRSAESAAAVETEQQQTTDVREEDEDMAASTEARGISKATSARKSATGGRKAAGGRKAGKRTGARASVDAKATAARQDAPRAPRAPRVKKERSVTAGIREHPKNKIMFLNTDGARAVVRKALTLLLKTGDPTDAERDDAKRLIARLDARM